jgi:two-component system chemotaxis response regulator CheB
LVAFISFARFARMAKIIVIGASQGGVQALKVLVGALPHDFAAPILVVQHVGSAPSMLPAILGYVGGPHAAFAMDGEVLSPARIYIAPPDHHMLVNDRVVELSRGPRENWARPAIDPLFRSAANSRGPGVIGIVLSGRLNDGTAGLYEIKRHGGVVMVQTPTEAEAPGMPQSVLDNVPVDYCVPVADMPELLIRLAAEPVSFPVLSVRGTVQEQDIIRPSAQTCPECGGAMRQELVGGLTRFRCHIGHVMTAEVLAASQLQELENGISAMLRGLNERAALCRDIAANHEANGRQRVAQGWRRAAEEAERREKAAQALTGADWAHPEGVVEVEAEI